MQLDRLGLPAMPSVVRIGPFMFSCVLAAGLSSLRLQEQVGPYVHRVYHEKLDVLWDAEGRVYFKVRQDTLQWYGFVGAGSS
jgi:hypothetical protein